MFKRALLLHLLRSRRNKKKKQNERTLTYWKTLQVERRVIYTTDPQYPALMILGNLPKLIVHANEQKVQAMRSIYDTVVGYWAQTPFRTPDAMTDEFLNEMDIEFAAKTQLDSATLEPNNDSADSKLFMIQFIVDHLALEVSGL